MLLRLLCAALLSSVVSVRAAETYTLGMIGKSQGNQFFEAAHSGAKAASRELGAKYGITIKIDCARPTRRTRRSRPSPSSSSS